MKRTGIAVRLAVLILACSLVILTGIVWYNYVVSRNIIISQDEHTGAGLAQATSARISKVLYAVQKVADSIAYTLEDAEISPKLIDDLGRRVLAGNPEIFGTAIAFEPYSFDPARLYFAPYHYRSQNRIASTNLGSRDYRYFHMDWYQLAKELDKAIWTEPYYDEGGGHALMCTYSVPFYRQVDGKRTFAGVVTADIDLTWLQSMISEVDVYDSGHVFLLSRYGTFISSPNPDLIMNETIFTWAEERGVPELRDVGRAMVQGKSGYRELKDLPGVGDVFLYYMPLPAENWSLAIVFPKDEMLAGVTHLSHTVAIIGLAGFLALAALVIFISGGITRPLRKLTVVANRVASGDLDQKVPEIRTRDEVGELATSFKTMKTSLKEYIANLTTATAERERIESELRIAREIQMGILPKLFPPFPERSEFDVYASIEPAKEVGGDLYDFFFVDDRHFCFLVGDVSGKGVPAAFFMAVTKTLLKVVAERGLDPGPILSKVNADLAAENESCMFVTLFLAIVDIETGETRYANAGHNPPVFLRKGSEPEWVPPLNEPVAGVMEDMEYSTKTMRMEPGDSLFIYTDGVTEAMDGDRNMYSDPRLLELLGTLGAVPAQELVTAVDVSIKAFTGGAEQSDDITMLAMQFHGPLGTNKES